jgi:hypothetical protein
MAKVQFNRDNKFDLQLSAALIHERGLGEIFATGRIEKIELKSETWQWEQTGNIAIEFRCDGQPSGIAITQADYWVHELRRDDETLLYLMFPIERLERLAREAFAAGRVCYSGGDDGRFDIILVKLSEVLR